MKRLLILVSLLILSACTVMDRPFPAWTRGPATDVALLKAREGGLWFQSENEISSENPTGDVCWNASPTLKGTSNLEVGHWYDLWRRDGLIIDSEPRRSQATSSIRGVNPCLVPEEEEEEAELGITEEDIEILDRMMSDEALKSVGVGGPIEVLLRLACRLLDS